MFQNLQLNVCKFNFNLRTHMGSLKVSQSFSNRFRDRLRVVQIVVEVFEYLWNKICNGNLINTSSAGLKMDFLPGIEKGKALTKAHNPRTPEWRFLMSLVSLKNRKFS